MSRALGKDVVITINIQFGMFLGWTEYCGKLKIPCAAFGTSKGQYLIPKLLFPKRLIEELDKQDEEPAMEPESKAHGFGRESEERHDQPIA